MRETQDILNAESEARAYEIYEKNLADLFEEDPDAYFQVYETCEPNSDATPEPVEDTINLYRRFLDDGIPF